MRERSQPSARYRALSIAVLTMLLVVGGTPSARADDLDERAREAAAARSGAPRERQTIDHAATATFPVTGVTARAFKVRDEQTDRVELVLLDASGRVLDPRALERAEEQAHRQRYGRLAPALADQLAGRAGSDRIGVNIWLKEPPSAPAARPSSARHASEDEIRAVVDAAHARRTGTVRGINGPFVRRLAGLGVTAQASGLAPVVVAELTPAEIQTVNTWPEVDTIYPSYRSVPHLDVARTTIGASTVQGLGITGAGVKVAVLELGGPIVTANPYLQGITNDTTYTCPQHYHSTAVVGIIHSSHTAQAPLPSYRGIAPDANLWVAGVCAVDLISTEQDARLMDRTDAAIAWGARAINLSWGRDSLLAVTAMDRFYDDIMQHEYLTVVNSAGNEGFNTGKERVNGPGLGYNVLTVGDFDDRNTTGRGDDIMDPQSSFLDPISSYGDREKPEVAAPGFDIVTTSVNPPWVLSQGSATSWAAPMVTGQAALLMQRQPTLSYWPEIVKAIIMASAIFNIEGDSRLSDKDGAGGISVSEADRIARRSSADWGETLFACAVPGLKVVDTIPLAVGQRFRAAIAWKQDTSYSHYATEMSADFDLQIVGPSGTLFTTSSSFDNGYEIVDFVAPTFGTYTMRITRFRCDISPGHVGWAWWRTSR